MKEFYDFLSNNELTPNAHYILYSMVYNLPIKGIPYASEQYKLSLNGFLEEHKSEVNGIFYTITQKAVHVVHESEVYICNIKTIKKVSKVKFEDWEEKIKQYNELFPKGKKEGSSVSFRTNPKELYEKFKWFFQEYPEYDWDMVLNATEKYIKVFEEACDYTYMQTSKYFIKKDDKNRVSTSTLSTHCYNIAEGNNEDISTGTYYFGP
jgi:hypothetical protein